MANIKSAKKRIEVAKVRTERNAAVKSRVKTAVRKVTAAAAAGDASAATASLRDAQRVIDKAAAKGVLHPRTAARRKARLARLSRKTAKA